MSKDEATRDDRVAECLRHLPRPLVLYTTLVLDARKWYHRLRMTATDASCSLPAAPLRTIV